ncbi:MAG: helix-turn-helix domain-containing protein, partial [Pseudonocardia sp.]|nr:helix-turn-helix domain-containing protein [Pseudonocardia sp.]
AAARARLATDVVGPLRAAGGELLHTLAVYLEGGGALEACARTLFVHPNTVRYRLKRIGEIVGRSPTDPRQAFVLRTALVADRTIEAGPVAAPGEPVATMCDTPGSPGTAGSRPAAETASI